MPAIAEPCIAHSLRHEIEIVVDELAPLHEHVREHLVLSHVLSGGQFEGDEAGAGQAVAVVQAVHVPTYIEIVCWVQI